MPDVVVPVHVSIEGAGADLLTPPTVRPGYLTTEFWVTVATDGLSLAAILHPGFNAAQWQPYVTGIATFAATVATAVYGLIRSHVKATALTMGAKRV